MVHAISIVSLLVLLCVGIEAQWVTEKVTEGIIARGDRYWVVKTNKRVNRPAFPAYIRFYNTHTRESEYEIQCSTSSQVLYLDEYPHIVFLTDGHLWSEGDSYYITLDEGVLYSDKDENSTEYLSPDFWTFQVVNPQYKH